MPAGVEMHSITVEEPGQGTGDEAPLIPLPGWAAPEGAAQAGLQEGAGDGLLGEGQPGNDAERQHGVERARTVCMWVFYLPRILATSIVLGLDWGKPCDQPLQTGVTCLLMVDVGRLLIRQTPQGMINPNMTPERYRILLLLEMATVGTYIALLSSLWRSNTCQETSPHLWKLAFVIILMNFVAMALCGLFVTCGCMLLCAATILRSFGVLRLPGEPAAASTEFIESLPIVHYDRVDDIGEEEEEGNESLCSICLESFQNHDAMRQLPCDHRFHVACVDSWLKINKTCPMCKHPVDVPKGGHDQHPPPENAHAEYARSNRFS